MKKALLNNSIIFILLISFYGIVEARAGGGGSSSGGGDFIGLVIAGIIYAIYEIRRMKMIKKAKKDLEEALKEDSSWNISELELAVNNVFYKYQEAWSEKNLDNMKEYMTKSYYEKAKQILEKKLNGKKNIIKDIAIQKLTLMSVRNMPGKEGDMFTMEVSASMIDYTINEITGNFIESTTYRNKNESTHDYQERAMNTPNSFKEYYIFIRYNGKWLLNNIKEQFSIVGDIINLSENELRKILENEKISESVNDDVLYKD